MEIIEIKSRWTGAVPYSGEHADVKEAVEAAVKARANLARAYLADANLAGATLADADLARANLAGANLIAAAPKLLEALEAMVEMYGPRDGEIVFDGPVYDAKAAIAQAKGEL